MVNRLEAFNKVKVFLPASYIKIVLNFDLMCIDLDLVAQTLFQLGKYLADHLSDGSKSRSICLHEWSRNSRACPCSYNSSEFQPVVFTKGK